MIAFTLAACGGLCRGAESYQPTYRDPMLEPWRWRTYPELSGLNAQCMGEGVDGTVWFGTNEGLWSYDGIDWRYHSHDRSVGGGVSSIARATDGTMYFAGPWGICQLKGDRWTGIFPAGMRFGGVNTVAAGRDGSIWVATSRGAVRYHQSKWTLFTGEPIAGELRTQQGSILDRIELLPESVTAKPRAAGLPTTRYDFSQVYVDNEDRIWLGTAGGEILCFKPSSEQSPGGAIGGTWTIFNEADGLVCGRNPSILQRQDKSVWVVYATGSGHANVFNGTVWTTIRLADLGLPGDCGDILETRDGTLWLSGRYMIGANRGGQWKLYEKPAAPIPSATNFMMQSSDGALWIAGPSTEILRLDYQTPKWFTLEGLNFQWESPSGAQWFLHRDGRVVVHENDRWISYGPEDGLIDTPVAIVGTRSGDVWVAGSHQHTAATARYREKRWTRLVHSEFSWGVEWRGVMESSDGSVWFTAAVDSSGPKEHRAGILQFRDEKWIHHHQPGRSPSNGTDSDVSSLLPATQRPEPIGKFLCIGESRDGRIWAGRNIIIYRDAQKWEIHAPPPNTPIGNIETMFTTREKDLWIGTRQFGAWCYDGKAWRHFQGKDSLVANSVRSFAQTTDGTIWAATDRGISRFDGMTWTADLMPAELIIPSEGGSLKACASGKIWVNRCGREWNLRGWSKMPPLDTTEVEFWTVCHHFQATPPETVITLGDQRVSQPGNISIHWRGSARWRSAKDAQLQYSYRLDDQPWSAFTAAQGQSFFTLPSGRHRFEVRARDLDFNVDPTPAVLEFVVLPPIWRQGWFIALMAVCALLILAQTIRMLRERHEVLATNRVLAAEIVERQRVEEALRRAKDAADAANKAKDQFLAVLSHELRTPLTPVLLLASGLENSKELPQDLKEDITAIRTNAEAEAHLIDDLLDLTRVAHNKLNLRMEATDIHVLLRRTVDACRSIADERQQTLAIDLAAERSHVTGDARRLQQVFKNLIENALKYTPVSGRITVRTYNTTRPRVREDSSGYVAVDALPKPSNGPADQELLVVEVVDTGVGIAPEALPVIFKPFEQAHRTLDQGVGGLGLGLAIAQGIVAAHGGAMCVHSPGPNRGTTFALYFVTVPRAPSRNDTLAAPHGAADPDRDDAHSQPRARVLLVEDHLVTCQSLAKLISKAGYHTRTATSVASARELLAAEPFDVLLSDLGLPDGDGTDLMKDIRAAGLPIRGIVVTGYGYEQDRRRALDAGFEMHLVKPVRADQLLDALDRLSGKDAAGAAKARSGASAGAD